MSSTMHLTLVLLCLVISHAHGSKHVLRWSDDSDAPSTTSCPSITSGHTNGANKLPLMHRLSPCSSLASGGARKHGKPSLHEILHRDGLRLRYLSQVQAASAVAAAAPAPSSPSSAGTPASGLSVPATQNVVPSLPGVYEYTVLAGYGTPAQQLPLFFDAGGLSYMQCKPCFSSGGQPCNGVAFDPSKSASFRTVACGSPDCGEATCSSGASCTFAFQNSTFVFGNGTVVTDTLTLSPSLTFDNFPVGCMQVDNDLFTDDVGVGYLDLGRSRRSLATRVLQSSPPGTAAFSYCLPADTDTHGFLTIAPSLSDYSGYADVKHVPLVANPFGHNFYYVDLVGITINGTDLPFPPSTFRGNGTVIDPQSAFTYLAPPVYAALRDEFRKVMAQYPPAPTFADLDTCYNFTLIKDNEYIYLPEIILRFGNGETMDLDDRQFMYFFREHLTDGFPFGCLAFAAGPDENFPNLLGSLMQRTKEIVYDVRGGMVAFVPSRCGLR